MTCSDNASAATLARNAFNVSAGKFASFQQSPQDYDIYLAEAFGRRLFRTYDASKQAVVRDPVFRAGIIRMQQIVSHLLLSAWQGEGHRSEG